jgi:hypothetical protein
MGAQPKRKITRAMRGMRRKGNTPKLAKDHTFSSIPLYKRGFFDKVMSLFSEKGSVATQEDAKKEKAKPASQTAGTNAQLSQSRASRLAAPVKKTTRTQHKGG